MESARSASCSNGVVVYYRPSFQTKAFVLAALLEQGADILIRNNEGMNALDIVIAKHHTELISPLLQKALALALTEQNELWKQKNNRYHHYPIYMAYWFPHAI